MIKPPDDNEIQDLLNSSDEKVRLRTVNNKYWKASADQVDQGLKDPSAKIRRAWITRKDVIPNESQMANGLTDRSAYVRIGFIQSGHPITKEQCDTLMMDQSVTVRRILAFCLNVNPTNAQFEKGIFSEPDYWNRSIWVSREDFIPSIEQMRIGMKDKSIAVRAAWSKKVVMNLPNSIVEDVLVDPEWTVRLSWAGRDDVDYTPEQINRGLADSSHIVSDKWKKWLKGTNMSAIQDVESSDTHSI